MNKLLKPLTLILYLLLTVVLAVATFVEYAQGTAFVTEHIYHSVPFVVLWGALGVLMIFSLLEKKNFQVWPKILLHLSFVVILAGALTTFLTSRKGMMHLRMGEPTFQYIEGETRMVCNVPFALELDTFYIDYYPGTDAPADYVSVVKIAGPHPQPSDPIPTFPKGEEQNDGQNISLPSLGRDKGEGLLFSISMNNVLDYEGYRFYQSSYDEDGRGTWLSVNYDPWGTGITYAGYVMLLVSMIGMMVHPRGGFHRLLKRVDSTRMKRDKQTDTEYLLMNNEELKSEKGAVPFRFFSFICVSLFMGTTSFAQETKKLSIISVEEAQEKREMQVIYHDRVVPLNTLARDFVRKLYGKDSFSGLTPEQILLSWQRFPDEWAYVPAIRIKSGELRAKLGIEGEYARMIDLFEYDKLTTYKLRHIMREASVAADESGKPSPLQKAVTETDEKVALVMMLQNGTLVRPLPTDGSVEPLGEAELKAELLYNRIPFTKILFMFNLTMGMVFLLLRIPQDPPPYPSQGRGVKCFARHFTLSPWRRSGWGPSALLLLSFLFALTGYLLRWYIGGRIPLSNGYETMLFLALCIMAFALLMARRFRPAIPFGFLLSGFTLLVAYLGQMNPQITPLMPVLVSPWLSLHVSVIMMAYALFAFILLNGVWALCVPREAERLMTYSRLMLYPAVFLLTAGIFIGAVWANVSWGRYWGWDPKEVWALITMLIYALPLHAASLSWFRRPRFFHAYLIVAFLAVLITYFGVNFFLGGMHSYA
ncbi:MAG: cytochrome c biogenesis protein CcsA [Bacteroidaceae bacterium]|nr:cytochrome c biogenesis protein CcsA [Bacteroidaceae bacterium]